MSSVDKVYLDGKEADRIYLGGELAYPVYENVAHVPVPLNATSTYHNTWGINGNYWGGESVKTLETQGGPFGRNFLRKTITSLAHPGSNGTWYIGSNIDVPTWGASDGIPVIAGTTYTVSFFYNTSVVSPSMQLYTGFYNAAGAKMTNVLSPAIPLRVGLWDRLSTTFTVPAGAVKVGIRTAGHPNAVIGSTFDATGLMVSVGTNELLPYRDYRSPKLMLS